MSIPFKEIRNDFICQYVKGKEIEKFIIGYPDFSCYGNKISLEIRVDAKIPEPIRLSPFFIHYSGRYQVNVTKINMNERKR